MSKKFQLADDPLLDAAIWAVLLLLVVGIFVGFGLGFGVAMMFF